MFNFINLSACSRFTATALTYNAAIWGFLIELAACLHEGKPVPTFPRCLCQQRKVHKLHAGKRPEKRNISHQLTGLHLTAALGKAMALLCKHDLDDKRREDSPVEVAVESMLDTSPLQVAGARDMDLMSCINHFLDHCCATEKGSVPVGLALRAGQDHVIDDFDISKLRRKAEKCLDWAKDPDRPATADMSVDQAAAIQLYTQQSCLYPRLNSALRDHKRPELLTPFLPYLKLLLTGLNKLPLVRATVYRGVCLDLHEQYNNLQGKVFTWWAFSSTTRKLENTSAFIGFADEKRSLFTIDAVGVDIAAFSSFPNESELLLLPGTSLTVTSGTNDEPDLWKFETSVWKAVQQQHHHQHDQQQHNQQH